MTKEQAINYLRSSGFSSKQIKEIVKALEQEPCEDCISRQTVLEYIEGSEAELGHSSENELVCRDIKEFPSVTPQLKSEVFDKIRAEIKALSPEPTAYDVVDGNPTKDAVWETLADVLKIIDKYKAESEGKDEIYHKTDSM